MAGFRVGFTVNPKAEPYITWLEENRPNLQLTRVFTGRDPRPHIVVTVDATDTDDAGEQAVAAWEEARASTRLPGIYATEAAPIARTDAWKVAEDPPTGYDVEGRKWRALLSMDGGWEGNPPTSEELDSLIKRRARDLVHVAPGHTPVGPAPVFYDMATPASLEPAELKTIVDAALVGWKNGKTVTAKILDPGHDNEIVAQ